MRPTAPGCRGWAVPLIALGLAACQGQSDLERQREANVAAAEREAPPRIIGGLAREGALAPADRQAWQAVLRWPSSCETSFQAAPATGDAGLTFHPAGAGVTTVAVQCAAGSDQPSHVFVRLDERGSSPVATVLTIPTYGAEDGRRITRSQASELAGDATISADGRTLTVLSVVPGRRDCGTWARYAIGTEHPRVLAAAARLPCPAAAGEPVDAAGSGAPAGWTAIAP